MIYHGQQVWRVSLHLRDLFEAPAALQRYLPDLANGHTINLTGFSLTKS